MSKAHAEHNEEVCDYLLDSGNFHDWVVTTAFYSALHFAQDRIFPYYHSDGNAYDSFTEYFLNCCNGISKHKATIDLVNKFDVQAGSQYKRLHDLCRTARYSSFKISKRKAQKARSTLNLLKHKFYATTLTT